jgi:hypothetical protein
VERSTAASNQAIRAEMARSVSIPRHESRDKELR